MEHKIAILTTKDVTHYCGCGNDCYQEIIDHITEWEIVSHDDFVNLTAASNKFGFVVLEQPVDTEKFIAKNIADYLEMCAAEKKRIEAENRKREADALAKKLKKALKDKESKLELFNRLKAELGDSVKS